MGSVVGKLEEQTTASMKLQVILSVITAVFMSVEGGSSNSRSRSSRGGTSSARSYGGGSSASSSSGLRKVGPDTVCTLEKKSRQGNDCFSEQECEQKCSTVNEQQCNTVNKQQCSTVNEQKCSTVQDRQCSTVQDR